MELSKTRFAYAPAACVAASSGDLLGSEIEDDRHAWADDDCTGSAGLLRAISPTTNLDYEDVPEAVAEIKVKNNVALTVDRLQ